MWDSICKYVFLAAIRFYKRHLTKYTPSCPHKPTCSTYAYNAIRDHGPRIGLDMAVQNIQSCGTRAKEKAA